MLVSRSVSWYDRWGPTGQIVKLLLSKYPGLRGGMNNQAPDHYRGTMMSVGTATVMRLRREIVARHSSHDGRFSVVRNPSDAFSRVVLQEFSQSRACFMRCFRSSQSTQLHPPRSHKLDHRCHILAVLLTQFITCNIPSDLSNSQLFRRTSKIIAHRLARQAPLSRR